MRDNIPDALITAFERQYDSSWNDPQLRNERMAMRYGWAAAMEAKPCLHQIQEPAPVQAAPAAVAVPENVREGAPYDNPAFEKLARELGVWGTAQSAVCAQFWLAATPAAVDVVRYPTEADPATETLLVLNNSDKLIETPAAAPVVLPEPDLYVRPSIAAYELPWQVCNGSASAEPAYLAETVRVLLATGGQAKAFQQRVQPWMMACFGAEISADTAERNHRFLEEALELVQACGCTASEAHQLVDYVFGRPMGDKQQEVGGVMVTLAALCLAQGLDMHVAGDVELARIWTKVEAIRAKQAAKPKHSPLPEHAPQAQADARDAERWRELTRNYELDDDLCLVKFEKGSTEFTVLTDGEADEVMDAAIAAAKGE